MNICGQDLAAIVIGVIFITFGFGYCAGYLVGLHSKKTAVDKSQHFSR